MSERAGTWVGTDGFKAPEILNCRPYTTKCDIYSLGCLLYMLCAYQTPPVTEPYEPIAEVYSQKLRNMIDSMLRKQPEERPSIDEVMEEIPILETFRAKEVEKKSYQRAIIKFNYKNILEEDFDIERVGEIHYLYI